MEKYEALEKAMCKELEMLEQKVKSLPELPVQDLEKIDKLAHALKSLATYKAMKEAEEDGYDRGMSGRRYMSRNGYPPDYSGYHPNWYPDSRMPGPNW